MYITHTPRCYSIATLAVELRRRLDRTRPRDDGLRRGAGQACALAELAHVADAIGSAGDRLADEKVRKSCGIARQALVRVKVRSDGGIAAGATRNARDDLAFCVLLDTGPDAFGADVTALDLGTAAAVEVALEAHALVVRETTECGCLGQGGACQMEEDGREQYS